MSSSGSNSSETDVGSVNATSSAAKPVPLCSPAPPRRNPPTAETRAPGTQAASAPTLAPAPTA
ncbi:hypothetical protein GQ600_3241 [Phytophthora cactorum]|nr:hypothetical protein GQ600_3241 [Phytophthora cactorum]